MKIVLSNVPDLTETMLDISGPEEVEIMISHKRDVIWINVEGICRLRASQIKILTVDDASDGGDQP